MRVYASLWSADLLAVGDAVRLVEEDVDGFHLDVFDGHNVRDLLFGPDFVAALRRHTGVLLDVHLNVEDPDYWALRFIDAGADMITVQASACPDIRATLSRIAEAGAQPAVGLEVAEALDTAADLLEEVDRVLVMATVLGIKGLGLDDQTLVRVRRLREARDRSARRPEIVVDGGIRQSTVVELAAAGTDGVVPGSLVFGDSDPRAAVRRLHGLPAQNPGAAP